jgi:phosphoglycolate phosphatase
MLQLGLPAWKLPLIARFMRMRMAQEIASISLFPGIATELERLSAAGVKLSIVSSNSEHNVRQVLGHRHAALFQRFECGVSLLGKGVRLQRVLRAHRVAPNDAIYVGDELRDLHAAHGEQIPFGAVGWGYARLEALAVQSPEVVFSRVEEISQVLAAGECR